MTDIENVVVGAGPAGLRAAQVLAEAGRDVLVVEKNERVGPKTCGGGLTAKAIAELLALGLPRESGLESVVRISFLGEPATSMDPDYGRVRTLARERLGRYQEEWARAAGAEIRTASAVSRIDLEHRTLTVNGTTHRYRHLIGADGTSSAVRRALGLPSPRVFFAGEYNIPGVRWDELLIEFDSAALASGYFWIFPHEDYTSVGAGIHKSAVAPAAIRPYLHRRMEALGIDPGATPYEGATIETEPVGLHFPGGVHLAGDAAGMASGLSAEGIYGALISGEEVARAILEPGYPMPKTRSWMRTKRIQDGLGRLWLGPGARGASLRLLHLLTRRQPMQRWTTEFFLAG